MKHPGLIVYEGPSLLSRQEIVAIVTFESSNDKTGPMAQLWILPRHKSPLKALHDNDNEGACGKCPLQGLFKRYLSKRKINGRRRRRGRMVNRVCYVNLGRAPEAIWKKYKRGGYEYLNRRQHRHLFTGGELRFGAYGDPAGLPVPLLRDLASWVDAHTGYTHQLPIVPAGRHAGLTELLMVSCETLEQDRQYKDAGYRTFTVLSPDDDPPADSVECPYYTHGVQCERCLLCCGTSKQAKSVFVRAHARTGYNLPIVREILKRKEIA